jgi:hypothetical protein
VRRTEVLIPGDTWNLFLQGDDGTPYSGPFKSWVSSRPKVVDVGASNGVLTAKGPGYTTIRAQIGDARSPADPTFDVAVFTQTQTHKLVYVPDPLPVNMSRPAQVTEKGTLLPASKVKWSSDNPSIALVDNHGVVHGIAVGETAIHAIAGNETVSAPVRVFDLADQGTGTPSVYFNGNQTVYYRHQFLYRPYSYEIMVNSVDGREDKSPTSLVFKVIDGLGTLGSFLNSVGTWGGKNAPVILDKTANLLVPGLRRLLPDMRDTQRQNYVSLAMRPIEEIPFGSDISRVIFIPKNKLHGILQDHDVRISEVDTSK